MCHVSSPEPCFLSGGLDSMCISRIYRIPAWIMPTFRKPPNPTDAAPYPSGSVVNDLFPTPTCPAGNTYSYLFPLDTTSSLNTASSVPTVASHEASPSHDTAPCLDTASSLDTANRRSSLATTPRTAGTIADTISMPCAVPVKNRSLAIQRSEVEKRQERRRRR